MEFEANNYILFFILGKQKPRPEGMPVIAWTVNMLYQIDEKYAFWGSFRDKSPHFKTEIPHFKTENGVSYPTF